METNVRYKSLSAYIIEFELVHDSITNESIKKSVNKNYAVFSTNKVLVKKISHKVRDKCLQKLKNFNRYEHDYDKIFEVGEIIEIWRNQLDKMGIDYFLTYEAAFNFQLMEFVPRYTGEHTKNYNNGQKYSTTEYKNGELNGFHKVWNNKFLIEESLWQNGVLHGNTTKYYKNGKLKKKFNLKNGKLDGKFEARHENSNIKVLCNYVNGTLHGSYSSWYSNVQKWIHVNYNNGVKCGLHYEWYKNGQMMVYGEYDSNGKLKIPHKKWTYDGKLQIVTN